MTDIQLANSAVAIGGMMIKYGAEIYRVEESIRLICSAYGEDEIEVFAIPSCIILTIVKNDEPVTKMMRTHTKYTNLDKVGRLNALSRYICQNKPDYDEIIKRIEEIKFSKTYSMPVLIAAYAVICAAFTLFFGGNIWDAAAAFVIGALIKLIMWGMDTIKISFFFINIVCSMAIAVVAIVCVHFGIAHNADNIIIGSLMTLVPGIAITNCMRDFIVGDALAGLLRMVEVVLVAVAVAGGVAIGFTAIGWLI